MKLLQASTLCLLTLSELIDARPSPYWSKQHPLGKPKTSLKSHNPYTPNYRDKYDNKVDAEGEGLDPLPYRNGDGSTVLGPWNRARSRQNPDLVRPPSTDHGTLQNMRWSFADSHIRIEVRTTSRGLSATSTNLMTGRRMDSTDHCSRAAN